MVKRIFLFVTALFILFPLFAQQQQTKTLDELINADDPGWTLVQQWMKEGKNKIEVLPKDKSKAEKALLQAQVTTRSPMGAIIYESGGILINNGWLRVLGSGNERLDRSLMEWNKGKAFKEIGDPPSFLLVADDVLGGFFAINVGGFGATDAGKVFYFAPNTLTWESTGLGYSEFLTFCFSGDLQKFYEGYYWTGWERDIAAISADQGISCFPYLFTKEGEDINKVLRTIVSIEELWTLYQGLVSQFRENGSR